MYAMGKETKNDLNEEECELILEVIRRDRDLRNQEKNRIEALKKQVLETREKIKLLTTNPHFNNMCCLECSSIFIPFFLPKIICQLCGFKFCSRCLVINNNESINVCSFCLTERAYKLQMNSWFYEEIRRKFGVHGGVKVIGNLFRNICWPSLKSEVLESSDSGYMSKMSNSSHCFNPSIHPGCIVSDNSVFSNYKEMFDSSLDKVRQAYQKKFNNFGERGNNALYDQTISAQKGVIALLLSSLCQEMKEMDINRRSDDGRETTDMKDVQVIKDFLMYAMAENKYQVYLFNISPVEVKMDEYIEHLSEAIISKTIDDLTVEESREDLSSLSDKLTLAVLAKMSHDSMYFDDDNNNISGGFEDNRDSHDNKLKINYSSKYDDLDNDDVDLESLKSFTETKSKEVPLPLIELPLDYAKQLYGISDNDNIIGGRPINFTDPDLDTISMTSSNMAINEIAQDVGSFERSTSENKWQLGGRGSLIMKKRIPYGVNDLYGTDRRDCDKDEDAKEMSSLHSDYNSDNEDLVMFLPDDDGKQINLTADNVKEICVFPARNDVSSKKQKSIDDPDVLEDTNLAMFRRKKSLDNERLKALSYTDDGHNGEEAPRFIKEPEDVSVCVGKNLKFECSVSGTFPIDVTWYKHSNNLVELNSLDERYVVWQRKCNFGLDIASANYDDHGYHMCMVSNNFGFCQKGFRVSISKEENSVETKQQKFSLENHWIDEDDDDAGNTNISKNNFKYGTSQEISKQINNDLLGVQKSSLSQRWLMASRDQQKDIKSRSLENMAERNQQTPSDDVFEEGQVRDLNIERMANEKNFIAENSLRDHIKHSSRSQQRTKQQSHDSPDFQHTYVPLSPVPINRDQKTSGDNSEEKIAHQSSSGSNEMKSQLTPVHVKLNLESVKVYQGVDCHRKVHIIPGSLPNDKNKLTGYSNLNHGKSPSSTTSHVITTEHSTPCAVSNNSKTQFSNTSLTLTNRNASTQQNLRNKTSFNEHGSYPKLGTFVSKVVIGEDCDIVSSYSALPKNKFK